MRRMVLAACAGGLVAFLIGFGINAALAAAGEETLSSAWVIGAMAGSFTVLGVANAGGRRAAQKADPEARQAALTQPPPAGMARLLVYREGRMGSRNGVDLQLDGRPVVQLVSPQFVALDLPPGRHAVSAVLAGQMNAASAAARSEIELAPGAVVVLRVTLAMRLTTSDVVLTRMDPAEDAMRRLARTPMVLAPGAAA